MPQRNVTSKNPPTQKRQIDVSRANLGMDASPYCDGGILSTIGLSFPLFYWWFWCRISHSINCRVWISSSHFPKCKGIHLSFWKTLSRRNNKNAKQRISFLALKFHLITIIFKQTIIIQKHLISWHNLILQPPHEANFHAVYLTSFMIFSHSVLYNCQITSVQMSNNIFKSIFIIVI